MNIEAVGKREQLNELRQKVQRLERGLGAEAAKVLPFGCTAIDALLPGGGLELGALHEVGAAQGLCHETVATLFIAGILARLNGPVLWCVKAPDLFAPGLALVGLKPDRLIFAEAGDDKNVLIAMEEGLHHNGLAAVVGEVKRLPLVAARRLHLAARATGVTAFVLYRQAGVEKGMEPTAAHTRWRAMALPSEPLPADEIGRAMWQVELLRARNGAKGIWTMEACDETGRLGRVSNMAHRQIAPEGLRLRAG